MQRRSLLKLGAASAIVLLVGAGIATYWQTGLKNGKLTVGGRDVFLSVARAILDGSLPTDPTAQQAALDGLLARIDGMAQAFPPHVQSELAQLLGLLATGAGRRTLAQSRTESR